MIDILFISETEIDPNLQLSIEEMLAQKIRITKPLAFNSAINKIKNSFFDHVLINGDLRKLDAYELCKEIKFNFRNTLHTFVYLPEANVNEASRFGLINAEVEDKESIKTLANKFFIEKAKVIDIEENIISVFSPYGGVGVSSISLLLAYTLDHLGKNSILIETSYQQSIKNLLDLGTNPALLTQKQSIGNSDPDWLLGFIAQTNLIPKLHYINLFNTIQEQDIYSNLIKDKIDAIIHDLPLYESRISMLSNALTLISKELDGSTLNLFNDIIQAGSKLSKDFIFDLGKDISSPLNRQLLRYSQTLILVLKDTPNLKEEYLSYKEIFIKRGIKNIILAISNISNKNNNYLSKISNEQWTEALDTVPILYPYSLEEIHSLIQDHKKLSFNSPLLNFGKRTINASNTKVDKLLEDSPKGILKFLLNQN